MTDIVGGKKISECTAATELNNADLFPLVQSSTNKYSLWSTIKSVLKTYFDTLYQGVMGADDNYVTNAEKIVIGNTSGANSGDETATSVGTIISGATEKTTPVDADYVGLMDSNALNILKKLSWANIKVTLKTYFDGLYTPKGKVVGINDQTGTTYTPVLADAGKYVRCTNDDSIAVTVPTNAAVSYDTGTVITIEQGGAGVITVAGDTDVTVNGYDSGLSTAGQYAVIQLLKTGSDEWTCIGGTT